MVPYLGSTLIVEAYIGGTKIYPDIKDNNITVTVLGDPTGTMITAHAQYEVASEVVIFVNCLSPSGIGTSTTVTILKGFIQGSVRASLPEGRFQSIGSYTPTEDSRYRYIVSGS